MQSVNTRQATRHGWSTGPSNIGQFHNWNTVVAWCENWILQTPFISPESRRKKTSFWTTAWRWQNLNWFTLSVPTKCLFQFGAYQGWKPLLSESSKETVCSWESSAGWVRKGRRGGRQGRETSAIDSVANSPQCDAMFRLMHRKQALTSQEMKWQTETSLCFPSLLSAGSC